MLHLLIKLDWSSSSLLLIESLACKKLFFFTFFRQFHEIFTAKTLIIILSCCVTYKAFLFVWASAINCRRVSKHYGRWRLLPLKTTLVDDLVNWFHCTTLDKVLSSFRMQISKWSDYIEKRLGFNYKRTLQWQWQYEVSQLRINLIHKIYANALKCQILNFLLTFNYFIYSKWLQDCS